MLVDLPECTFKFHQISMKYWLFNRDPYFMANLIIPTFHWIVFLSSPTTNSTLNSLLPGELNGWFLEFHMVSDAMYGYIHLHLVWLVVEPTPSKNMSQNWIISPNRVGNKKYWKTPPRFSCFCW